MDLSIIIVSYNTKELLSSCLDSIKAAINNLKTEVFVVDNDSSDGTCDLIIKNYPWVKLIENKKNLGFSKANNLALRKSKGQYFLILNPDTKLMSDTLIKMYDFMQKNKNVSVATCTVQLENGSLDLDCRRHFPTPLRALTHFLGLSKIFKGSKIFDQYYMGYMSDKESHEIDACVGAFMIIRAKDLKEVGYFDEDFFFYGEDLDLCFRFKKQGYNIFYTPITHIIHYKGAASGLKQSSKHLTKATRQSRKRAILESTRAMELFYQKHYQNDYAFFINWLVLVSIKVVTVFRLLKT